MISIGKLTNAESAVQYLQHAIAENQLDYYAHNGEAPGQWDGYGAQLLGLQGQVTPDQLRLLLNGLDPNTGQPLAKKWDSQRIVAFDVTFSAPKSVSLLYAIGNEEVRKAVLEAHNQGVDAVVQYLQKHAAFARQYNPDLHQVEPVSAHLVMPRFIHRTSRPVTDPRTGKTTVDPQLHTHIPIPTWVCRPDGSWSALLSEPLYQHAAAAGAVGQAVMRKHLVEKLGIEAEVMPNGTFEVKGINEAMRREFSKRRQQIELAEALFGQMDIAGREKANLATREKKPEVLVGPELVLEWKERAHKVGLTQKLVIHLLHRHEPKRTLDVTEDSIDRLVGEHGLTQEVATFSRRDVVRKLTTLAPDGMTLAQIEWATDQVFTSGAVVPLGVKQNDGVNSPLPNPLGLNAQPQLASDYIASLVTQNHGPSAFAIYQTPATRVGQKYPQRVPTTREPQFDGHTAQLTQLGVERGVGENPVRLSPTARKAGPGLLASLLEDYRAQLDANQPATNDRDESRRLELAEVRYSTPEMVTLERRMLEVSLARRNSSVCEIPEPCVSNALATHKTLTAEQRRMVEAICLSGDGVQLIEGVAGAGKTFALNTCRELFQSQGHQVVGLALAGRAAQTLQEEAAIPSHTIFSALRALNTEHVAPGTVVIVDEAGMVGSRQLAKLVEITARDNAKLVLCGDSHQLQPIDCGAGFRALIDNLGSIQLTQSVRQKELWEREALNAIREGNIELAVDAYQEHERIVVSDSAMERRRQVVAAALESTREGNDTVVLTKTRDEAMAVNELTRAVLQASGELSGPAVDVGEREFCVGDKIICTRNDRRLGVTNGLRGEVVGVDPEKQALVLRAGGRDVVIPAQRYEHLDYGYALTAHKAQGVTVDTALVVGSESSSREWAYSVMSRARQETRYFTIAKPPTLEVDALNQVKEDLTVAQKLTRAWSPLEAKETTLDYGVPSRM